MADNITLMDGAGGQLASNDVDGVQVLRCKLQVGLDGEATDVSEQAPLPIMARAAGLSVFQAVGLGTTGSVVKSSPGELLGWHLGNRGTSGAFVKVYDTGQTPQVGTDVPATTFFVPAAGAVSSRHRNGITFANGIAVAATFGAGDEDTQAPGADAVVVSLFYR